MISNSFAKSLSGTAISEPLVPPSERDSLYLRPCKVKTSHRFALASYNLDLPCYFGLQNFFNGYTLRAFRYLKNLKKSRFLKN